MTFVRSLSFSIAFYMWSLAVSLAIAPLLLAPRRWMVRSWTVWAHGVIWLLRIVCSVRVEVRGKANIPAGAALVAAKHQCMFDVFAQFAWLPAACFIMKRELSWLPFLGWYALKGGTIVVDRDGHSTALRRMVSEAKVRFAEGRQLVIFPEGTRGEPGQAGAYKPGIAALYRELGVAVHPVATNAGVHWARKGMRRTPGLIVFEYLEPIPPGLKRAEFMRLLEARIETASTALLAL